MTEGFITLHRQVMHKGFWKNPAYAHLWVHILLRANHKATEVLFNGHTVTLKAGQFITGRLALSEETGLSPSSVERALKLFEIEQQIEQQKTNKFRLITVKKWQQYQDKRTAERTTSGQPADNQRTQTTMKQCNNETREQGNSMIAPPALTPREDAIDFFQDPDVRQPIIEALSGKGIPPEALKAEVDKFVLYWTEPTPNGKRQRWQTEKTFEVKRRLVTWLTNASKRGRYNSQQAEPKGIRL